MRRRDVLKGLSATTLAVAAFPKPALAQNTAANTLRVIHGSNIASIDPIWTTAAATNNFAMLVYDQLFGMDNSYKIRPQMAEGWTVEDNARTYVVTLREGLKFHDGEPVRSNDCIASIARWAKKDSTGQALNALLDTMEAVDDRTFRIRLKQSFTLLPDVIGKPNSSQCVIMPERFASLPPTEQTPEAIGSGPFRFLPEEWVTGSHMHFAKFEGYIPRNEPPDGNAGAKIANVDRVELSFISDASTAMASLQAGEHDYWDAPLPDLIPLLRMDPNLTVHRRALAGVFYSLVMNHLQAPFDNPAIRQAVAMAVDQEAYITAASGGDPEGSGYCTTFFMCGTPNAKEEFGAVLKERNIEKARAALQAAGYNGEKVVLIGAGDPPQLGAIAQVTDDLLRRMGFNVEFVATDFAGMIQRRQNRGPVDEGGWSVFNSTYGGLGLMDPLTNIMLRGAGEGSWFGWPTNPELERLRSQWIASSDPAEQATLADAIQVEAFKTLPYIPLGYSRQPHVWRNNLTGVLDAPLSPFWNIGKTA